MATTAPASTGTGPPRTITNLATMRIRRRSDLNNWCKGFRLVADQLSALALSLEAELYQQLIQKHGRDHEARRMARRATRPLRVLAAAIHAAGMLAPRAYRTYARTYAHEIAPPATAKGRTFDHRN
jgi:hypothetical protein